jgi:hypothetical protein
MAMAAMPRYDVGVAERDEHLPERNATDEQGVDRSIIREMLALSPAERLRRLEELVDMILRIREANGFSSLP